MRRLFFLTLSVVSFSVTILATTIHVPDDLPTIQAGLNIATEGDTVLVASGTYYENIIWPAVNGIKLIGSGEEVCTIDGDQQGSVIRFEAYLNGIVDTTTLIQDFTIQNGYAQGFGGYGTGGGIFCQSASPRLEHMTLAGNLSRFMGGGTHLENSNPRLENVTIRDNSADIGGGISCSDSNPDLAQVMINGNSAEFGGGIFCWNSGPTFMDAEVTENSADYRGGGIYCENARPCFLNVTITGNSADSGGGISCWYSGPTLMNVTITGNSAEVGGGISCTDYSDPTLINCILWNDSPQEIDLSSSIILVSCSDIEGGWTGEHNIDADPLFCDSENDDYRLQIDSPCRTDVCGFMGYTGETCEGEGVDDTIAESAGLSLSRNYPNPFNPTTTIEFTLPYPEQIDLSLYNIMGQRVAVLAEGTYTAGIHRVIFDAQSSSPGAGSSRPLASSVYLYRLTTDEEVISRKMILIR
ncbi:MAG: T9SS type A sorting domain-containing protein [Candidatus Delongbacteria bacterium]|nr:T9SS type A sorting domain-containing protein [Candidatus Delongbacteria bacterium]